MNRRWFVKSGLLVSGLAAMPRVALAALTPTPQQTEGPFYPRELPLDHDNDLLKIAGKSGRVMGTPLHLFGRILNTDGAAIDGAIIQIWQCDAKGIYHHPRDRAAGRDPNFQGFGETRSNVEGACRFRTIKPVPYSWRAPHIHLKVFTPDGMETLTTQLYVAGDPANERDGIYRAIATEAERKAVTLEIAQAPELGGNALAAQFTIVIR